jgi:hypothetical protein
MQPRERGAGADGSGGVGHVVEHTEDWIWMGSALILQDDLKPSGEFAVFKEEADQASELPGVFWGGVELVLELEKSVSILELSSTSCAVSFSICAISLSSCFILCSCAICRCCSWILSCSLSICSCCILCSYSISLRSNSISLSS